MKNINFSVIIPCYNSEKYIAQAIQSSLDQTHKPFEILIYNDGSKDNTFRIISEYSVAHDRIKIFSSDINRGAGYARNFLLQKCNGNYIAFLDADDVWLKNKLKIQSQLIIKEDLDIVGCTIELFNLERKKIGFRRGRNNIKFNDLLKFNWIGMSGAVVSKSLLDSTLMPLIRKRQDYAYFLNLFYKNSNLRIGFCEEVLVYYFRLPSSLSSNKIDAIKYNFLVLRQYGRQSFLSSVKFLIFHIANRILAD